MPRLQVCEICEFNTRASGESAPNAIYESACQIKAPSDFVLYKAATLQFNSILYVRSFFCVWLRAGALSKSSRFFCARFCFVCTSFERHSGANLELWRLFERPARSNRANNLASNLPRRIK